MDMMDMCNLLTFTHMRTYILHTIKIKEKKKMQDIVLFVSDFSWDYYPET